MNSRPKRAKVMSNEAKEQHFLQSKTSETTSPAIATNEVKEARDRAPPPYKLGVTPGDGNCWLHATLLYLFFLLQWEGLHAMRDAMEEIAPGSGSKAVAMHRLVSEYRVCGPACLQSSVWMDMIRAVKARVADVLPQLLRRDGWLSDYINKQVAIARQENRNSEASTRFGLACVLGVDLHIWSPHVPSQRLQVVRSHRGGITSHNFMMLPSRLTSHVDIFDHHSWDDSYSAMLPDDAIDAALPNVSADSLVALVSTPAQPESHGQRSPPARRRGAYDESSCVVNIERSNYIVAKRRSLWRARKRRQRKASATSK